MSQRRTTYLKSRSRSGFTLIELMVTVAVVGILALVAMPAMTDLVNNSRVAGQTEELVSSIQLARAEAVRRNVRVTLCPTNGSNTISTDCAGSTSWTNWAAITRSETVVLADRVLRNNTASGGMQVTGPAAGIVFKPSGLIDSEQALQVAKSSHKRCLTVRISGVVSVAKGACP
jgi:type IV fimbrial biogenesis protein FimT